MPVDFDNKKFLEHQYEFSDAFIYDVNEAHWLIIQATFPQMFQVVNILPNSMTTMVLGLHVNGILAHTNKKD
jgi:hypothetical protein